jgi:hypothetical protein
MTKYPAYRFLLFIGTFAAILGGVFLAFLALGAGGNASTTAGVSANTVDAASSSPDVAELAMMAALNKQQPSTTTATSSISLRPTKLTPAPAATPISPSVAKLISAVVSNNLSYQLGNFALSLADAVRSISTPSTSQQSLPQQSSTTPQPMIEPVAQPVAVTSSTATSTATTTATIATTTLTLPYVVNNFSTMTGWQGEWGDVSIKSSSLAIGATPSSTGGEALLLNSGAWTNYLAKVIVDWQSGQTFSLIARYNPGMNNVSCEFLNGGGISMYRTINGQRTLLGMGTMNGFNANAPVTASIQVKDDHVECGLNGNVVKDYMYSGMPTSLLSGGFDIETWDPTPGKAQILIQSVDVEPAY